MMEIIYDVELMAMIDCLLCCIRSENLLNEYYIETSYLR